MSTVSWPETRRELAAGWKLILTGFIGLALGTTGIFIFTQGLFIKPLQAEFGWSRAQVASMPTIFGLTLAISYPLMGFLLDRFETRVVAATSILCFSIGLVALSLMTGNLGVYMAIILFIAVCGSGTATSYVRLVGSAFFKARGLALGLTMTGTGLAATFMPGLLGAYLQQHGWRASYRVLAVVALVALPLVALFASDGATRSGPSNMTGLTMRLAMRTRTFWLLGGTFAFGGAAVSGIMPHFIPLMQDMGMSVVEAGALAGGIGLAIIGSRVFTGVLCDHFFAPHVAAIVLAFSAIGCLGLLMIGPGFAAMAALLIGLGLGAEIDLAGYMSARYFGLRSYGSILGMQYGLFGAGSGLGALTFGLLYDHFGNYQWALAVAAGLLFFAVICARLLGPYSNHALAGSLAQSNGDSHQLTNVAPSDLGSR